MTQELTKLGGGGDNDLVIQLGFMIKRVKGKQYVYEYVRINGKPIVKYVGPLEEIVRTYQALRAGITVNHRLKSREIRALSTHIVDNLMKNIQKTMNFWWARGDSNPGPPPRQGGVLTELDDGPQP